MKNFSKILLVSVLLVISVASFLMTTNYYEINDTFLYGNIPEWIVYAIWILTASVCFFVVANELEKAWTKISLGALTSFLVTVAVFITNNFWRCITVNLTFGEGDPITYWTVLNWDLNYTYGYGRYRYLLVFGITAIVCGITVLLAHLDAKAKLKKIVASRLLKWLSVEEVVNEKTEG